MNSEHPGFAARCGDAALTVIVIPFVGVTIACASMAIFTCADLVWTDLLHTNPYRSLGDVMSMMLLSPVYGIVLAIGLVGLPIAAEGVLAAVATLLWRRPTLSGMAGVAVASTVLFVRWC